MRLDHLLSKETVSDDHASGVQVILVDLTLRGKYTKDFPLVGEIDSLVHHCSIFRARSLSRNGDIAQLGERLPCTQEVTSSNLVISTTAEAGA